MADKNDRLEITELFMAQADKDRRFYGTISRGFDASGTPVVSGKIKVLDGFLLAQAGTQDVLGRRLDELVVMVLDMGLHLDAGATFTTCEFTFFSN